MTYDGWCGTHGHFDAVAPSSECPRCSDYWRLPMPLPPEREAMIDRFLRAVDDAAPPEPLSRRQEKLALIRILRDTTNSSDIHERCVAIVGTGETS